MISVLNAVVGGSVVTLFVAVLDGPIGAAVAAGIVAGAASLTICHRWERGAHIAAAASVSARVPSTPPAGS
jgi:hypothetical protein